MVVYNCVINGIQSTFSSRDDLPISMTLLEYEGEWAIFKDSTSDTIIKICPNGMFKFFPELSGRYYKVSIDYGGKIYDRMIIRAKPYRSIIIGQE